MSERIDGMFTSISREYDILNHLFSMGLDIWWRRRAAYLALPINGGKVLDVAAGTGDLSIAIMDASLKRGRRISVRGVDLNRSMLSIARRKVKRLGAEGITFSLGDALALDYPDGAFDSVSTGFSLRNFDDISLFMGEAKRVLRRNGKLVALDMALPKGSLSRPLLNAYLSAVGIAGGAVDREAYGWLVKSVRGFDSGAAAKKASLAGFRKVAVETLFPGIAFILTAVK
ncbi:MAG: ubiquinone/menaquinone biosynthesis methyltransferase [Candidatus Marsarchaeota archaeon]|jgi:demethylmenaquinone methyltransferase/2-methoxy-6-polyprenyl-1,4-benzoquinol methylase|nr:ubiquinone/menaquinone biosynthesis methyltransferase [Candidatus Marsarchaeota archaeon]